MLEIAVGWDVGFEGRVAVPGLVDVDAGFVGGPVAIWAALR